MSTTEVPPIIRIDCYVLTYIYIYIYIEREREAHSYAFERGGGDTFEI
jgi:hypothetical protein